MGEKERVGHYYAQVADQDSQTSPDIISRALKQWLRGYRVKDPVLDVGTGVGKNLESLVGEHSAFGVDISLAAARSSSAFAPTVVTDGTALPFGDETFGAAVCTEVLEHVTDPGAVLGEIARVVRRGALVFVTTPNYANVAGLHKWLADRRSGRGDWNPWGAHKGGYEAFMTGHRLLAAARPCFELVTARGWDFGQAMTGRFGVLDRLAWSRPGQALLRLLLPRLEGSSGRFLAWHGMHIELVLRRPAAADGV